MKYLQSYQPDVFFFADRIGYVQAWKHGNIFWLECKGVKGEYFTHKFSGYDMINTCETYNGVFFAQAGKKNVTVRMKHLLAMAGPGKE